MRVGYKRVSTIDQNSDRQLEGTEVDKLFIDKCSGKDMKRPKLEEMLQFLREGDSLFVHSMDRMARNLRDLKKMIDDLLEKGVQISFLKEGLTFNNVKTPIADLMLGIIGSIAEFEYNLIRERQLEGIALAKKRGAYTGRKHALNHEQVKELQQMFLSGFHKNKIAKHFKISRETVYKYLRDNPVKIIIGRSDEPFDTIKIGGRENL